MKKDFWLKILLLLSLCLGYVACRQKIFYQPGPRVDMRSKVIELAVALEGLSYRFGGTDIDGFDCSGLVYYVYSCYGIIVPRTAKEQMLCGRAIMLSEALPGDLLIFKLSSGWHSAIYLGNYQFLHAPGKGQLVRIEKINDFWKRQLRRVIAVI